jgi:chitodextrinase
VGVNARATSESQATISWTTNEEVISLVQYGETPAVLNQTQTELSTSKNHQITLNELAPNTTYFYKIQVGSEVYDNNGQPWSFKTKVGTALQPTNSPAPSVFTEENFRQAFGSSTAEYDFNQDGVVGVLDFKLCLQQGQCQ